MASSSRLFSICPRVAKRGSQLVACTAWRLRVLSLGWLYREVRIDPGKQEIEIYRRYLWVFPRRRRVRFGAIAAITYGYEDFGSSLSWAHDSVDLYSVGLRLHDDEELHLFYFFGDGEFSNNGPLPDWLYWDEFLFDSSGTQERESRTFAELLSKMIDVSIVPASR